MPEIGPGEAAADGTAAARINGCIVHLVPLVFDIHGTLPGKELAVAGIAGRHHAVEEVYAPPHALDDIGRRAHAHEVAGLVPGRMGQHHIQDAVHDVRRLPHRQAANAVAVAVQLGALLHAPDPQVLVGAALVDAEEQLAGVQAAGRGI